MSSGTDVPLSLLVRRCFDFVFEVMFGLFYPFFDIISELLVFTIQVVKLPLLKPAHQDVHVVFFKP